MPAPSASPASSGARHSEERFVKLKRKLEELHYFEPLGVESVALVEKLVSDVCTTTEQYQIVRHKAERMQHDHSAYHAKSQPLSRENSRLLAENSELHLELIRAKEEADERDHAKQTQLKKLEGEEKDLRFINSQLSKKVAELERELEGAQHAMHADIHHRAALQITSSDPAAAPRHGHATVQISGPMPAPAAQPSGRGTARPEGQSVRPIFHGLGFSSIAVSE